MFTKKMKKYFSYTLFLYTYLSSLIIRNTLILAYYNINICNKWILCLTIIFYQNFCNSEKWKCFYEQFAANVLGSKRKDQFWRKMRIAHSKPFIVKCHRVFFDSSSTFVLKGLQIKVRYLIQKPNAFKIYRTLEKKKLQFSR